MILYDTICENSIDNTYKHTTAFAIVTDCETKGVKSPKVSFSVRRVNISIFVEISLFYFPIFNSLFTF